MLKRNLEEISNSFVLFVLEIEMSKKNTLQFFLTVGYQIHGLVNGLERLREMNNQQNVAIILKF